MNKHKYCDKHGTELDSHTNMHVIGCNARVISTSDMMCDVRDFSPDISPLKVKIVYAGVEYSCLYTGLDYILVIRNRLHVPAMVHNLIPPFIMRELGVIVNDMAKIHLNNPMEEDHSLFFQEVNLRIPLQLHGVLSYFETIKPSTQSLNENENIYLLTPDKWNPHDTGYTSNKDGILDHEGNMIFHKHRQQIYLSDVQEDTYMYAAMTISSV